MVKVLNSEPSQLIVPGPRIEMVRLMFPDVNCGAWEDAAGLMQSSTRSVTPPDVSGDIPVAFGRCTPAPIAELLLRCVIASGYPLCSVATTFIHQPPAIRSSQRFVESI